MSRALGDLVVARGLADASAVDRAIERQRQQAKGGVFRRLGEILVEDGILSSEQVNELLRLQGKQIRVCSVCFAQYNVDQEADPASIRCGRCGHDLVVPEKAPGLNVEDDLAQRSKAARALELASAARTDSERLRIIGDIAVRRFGPYEILGEVSRGGMGIVYKAKQAELERYIALKVLLNAGSSNDESVRRFRREARAVSRLRHPNIVAIHDVGVIDGVNYFSMDYIEGLTLDQAVTAEALTHREIAEIFVKVADAVDYAHHQGIVHRDLKPRNILVDKRRVPTVIDFGIARVESKHEESAEHGALTKSGEILGSPAYLAPEYITGEVPDYDVPADVWSLGACLYAALSGRAPHANADTIRIIRSAATAEAPSLRSIAKSVDRGLARVVMTAVERDRKNRYRSAAELADDLRRWLDGEEISGRSSPLARWWQRVRPKVAAGAGLAVSIALVWSTGYTYRLMVDAQSAEGQPDLLRERLGAKTVRLAEALIKQGDPQGAERELSDVLGLVHGARRVEALYLRAKARRAMGRDDLALADEKEAAAAVGQKP
ncbi:MAG TPA: protein kinase [Planctomycetota bacterium]|nr:protein kinase [Planctomycetota bacterium]